MTDWIGKTFTSTVGRDHLEALVDLENRMAGTEGERRGAELTRDALAEAGARNARLEEFPIQGWVRGDSEIRADGTVQACIALPRSPSEEAAGELIDLGYGLPEDFEEADIEGRVVMVRSDVPEYFDRYIHRREKYYYAVAGGASAFVYRNHVEGCLPPTGSVGTPEEPIGDIPAVGVSSEVGARLARRFDGREVSIAVEAEIDEARSQNVHAEMGPDTDEAVLVTGHVDAHDIAEGASDNGAGTAMVIEIANALSERSDELETRVEFVVYGAEEVGLVGSDHHAANADHGSIEAIVNSDGVVRGRTLEFYTHGFSELEAAAERVADRFDHPVKTVPRMGPHSDHWPFAQWGVPGYHVMSDTGELGRGWGHTFADTIEKVDVRDLREQAVVLTELVVDLAREGTTIEHRAPEEIAAALEDEGQAAGMKVIGDWPYGE
ncbi:M28 family peptidase [Halalkalicoccus sp. NIPERK01]|uniref:M28 family peptidase n=1 Tax=Halalkalicoccus sp. NIPERK01 TaxID=3053469 RepID=UPI00256F0FBA|nr:M28 family peptidase [Halalkalicoccus sp. NIPERK01]MDL5360417.1 M28 family peptidase [Halalkalicoccus sp. NIPERK01]